MVLRMFEAWDRVAYNKTLEVCGWSLIFDLRFHSVSVWQPLAGHFWPESLLRSLCSILNVDGFHWHLQWFRRQGRFDLRSLTFDLWPTLVILEISFWDEFTPLVQKNYPILVVSKNERGYEVRQTRFHRGYVDETYRDETWVQRTNTKDQRSISALAGRFLCRSEGRLRIRTCGDRRRSELWREMVRWKGWKCMFQWREMSVDWDSVVGRKVGYWNWLAFGIEPR